MNRYILLILFTGLLVSTCKPGHKKVFTINKGININHWLSQNKKRGTYRDTLFTEKDIIYIRQMGFDHIRLPFDEEQLWDMNGNKTDTAFRLLHQAMGWCKKHNLRVIADLHILRSFYFNRKENTLWTDIKEQDKFISLWKDLSAELHHYPVWLLAYELMNEPVTDDPGKWNALVARCIDTLRKYEPERKIIVGSNMWQSTATFKDLCVPANDSNIILSFHFYEPFLITHYQASWTHIRDYHGPVNYPGKIISDSIFYTLPDSVKHNLARHSMVFTADTLEKLVLLAIKRAAELDLPVYCGEWGCKQSVPHSTRMNWYRDVIRIFNKYAIPWDIWGYYGQFGLFDQATGKRNDEMLSILMQ